MTKTKIKIIVAFCFQLLLFIGCNQTNDIRIDNNLDIHINSVKLKEYKGKKIKEFLKEVSREDFIRAYEIKKRINELEKWRFRYHDGIIIEFSLIEKRNRSSLFFCVKIIFIGITPLTYKKYNCFRYFPDKLIFSCF